MGKCLNCGTEFEDDNKCPKCSQEKDDNMDWELLTTVVNDIDFEMVAGILQMGEIPVIRKVKGIDGFLQIILGTPVSGIDIYVPKDRFQEATDLLNADVNEEDFPEEEKDTQEADK
jgi:hypothetical protein